MPSIMMKPYFWSEDSRKLSASVWNLLSHLRASAWSLGPQRNRSRASLLPAGDGLRFSGCARACSSHRYSEVLMGLKGSKSIVSFFSLFSSVSTVPQ